MNTTYYKEGYLARPNIECPYDIDGHYTESEKAEQWYIGRNQALEDRYTSRLKAEYELQQAVMTPGQINSRPYLITRTVKYTATYNPKYGDDRECECGHPYYRHFDWMEQNLAVGCKYCGCSFTEKKVDSDPNLG